MKLLCYCAVVLLCLVVAAEEYLNAYEGDACKEENGSLWTCMKLNRCRKYRNSGNRQRCKSNGVYSLVCCEPRKVNTSPVGLKSKEMCKKYAQSVYVKVPAPYGVGDPVWRDTCVTVKPLITNGENANPMEFPHMALIGYGEKDSIKWLAGGSLISERFVLSAAHCTHVTYIGLARWVRLGEYNVNSKKDDEDGLAQPVDYEIIERINHPRYNPSSDYYDIALYKLSSEVEFNEYIRPICLQTDHQFPETNAIATGWGRTQYGGRMSDILQKVEITLTPQRECIAAYGAKTSKRQHGITYETMLCAGNIVNHSDTCQSDSGGPLQTLLTDPYCMYMQVGITSFGSRCGEKPGVYTRVSHYVPWIESIVWP